MADISPRERIHDTLPAGYVCQPSAKQLLRPIRDRMPVILSPDDYEAWLGEDQVRNVADLLQPYPSNALRAYRVSTAVNSPKNDGPECVEPAAS